MTLKHIRQTLILIVFTMAFAGCKNSEIDNRPVVEFSNFDAGTIGCTQRSFPGEQPAKRCMYWTNLR